MLQNAIAPEIVDWIFAPIEPVESDYLNSELDRFCDLTREQQEAERAADEYAMDADHGAWIASGEPDDSVVLLASWQERRASERAAAEAERDSLHKQMLATNGDDDLTDSQAAEYESALAGWHKKYDHLFHQSKLSVDKESSAMSVVPFPVPAAPPQKLIQSSAEFVAGFVPPEYLLDGILQRRFCYALTAQTGAGKTAVALLLAANVALGRRLGDRDVERGRVLYFASENSVDVQARWVAMAQHSKFNVDTIDVHFVSGATKLSEITERITIEAQALGDLALVIVDTSAATFEGEDENSNVHVMEHAKRMRSMTLLRGGPTVLVLCHPTKRAAADDLIPRGGGAFLAEIDGNLCARKSDIAVEIHWCGKFRGMDFAPMIFRLDAVTAERLKDRRGRNIGTVVATPLDEAGRASIVAAGRRDEDMVLRALHKFPRASLADLAKALGWTYGKGDRPNKMKVKRAIENLIGAKLAVTHRGTWRVTPKGEQELNAIDNSLVTGAVTIRDETPHKPL